MVYGEIMNKIIPKASLESWAIKKFYECRSTMDLMATAKNNIDMTVIAIVALLEVDSSLRYQGIDEKEVEYIKSCHNFLYDRVRYLPVSKEISVQ